MGPIQVLVFRAVAIFSVFNYSNRRVHYRWCYLLYIHDPMRNKTFSFKIRLRLALTSAALAILGQKVSRRELGRIVGCCSQVITKNIDVCAQVLTPINRNPRADISSAINRISESGERVSLRAIMKYARCSNGTLQKHRDLWEHLVPMMTKRERNAKDKIAAAVETISESGGEVSVRAILALVSCSPTTVRKYRYLWEHLVPKPPKQEPAEIWHEQVRRLFDRADEPNVDLQTLASQIAWWASLAPSQEDFIWCNKGIQSLKSRMAHEEAIAI